MDGWWGVWDSMTVGEPGIAKWRAESVFKGLSESVRGNGQRTDGGQTATSAGFRDPGVQQNHNSGTALLGKRRNESDCRTSHSLDACPTLLATSSGVAQKHPESGLPPMSDPTKASMAPLLATSHQMQSTCNKPMTAIAFLLTLPTLQPQC